MRAIGIVILAVVALFTGRCSVFFLAASIPGFSRDGTRELRLGASGAGLAIAALCICLIRRLLRSANTTAPVQAPPNEHG